MSQRKEITILAVVSVVLISLAFFTNSEYPLEFGLCKSVIPGQSYSDGRVSLSSIPDNYCGDLQDSIVFPFLVSGIVVFVVSFFLLFVREQVYLSWRKFAIWAVPIGALILIVAPTDRGGGFPSGLDITKETASWGVAILFLVISLVIIVQKTIKLRNS